MLAGGIGTIMGIAEPNTQRVEVGAGPPTTVAYRVALMKGTEMTSTQPLWISTQAHERLSREMATLRRLCASGPADMDTDDNAMAIQHAWQARIQQIQDVLNHAVVGHDPPDDGIAEPGMVLTIRYDSTGDTETFLLGVRGAEYGDLEVYSVESPLGAALLGARPGERRTYRLPMGATLTVTLLEALPYGVHKADSQRSERAGSTETKAVTAQENGARWRFCWRERARPDR